MTQFQKTLTACFFLRFSLEYGYLIAITHLNMWQVSQPEIPCDVIKLCALQDENKNHTDTGSRTLTELEHLMIYSILPFSSGYYIQL